MKKEIKNLETYAAYQRFQSIYKTMQKNMESKNPKVVQTKNGRIMSLSKCAVCNIKKPRFIKE